MAKRGKHSKHQRAKRSHHNKYAHEPKTSSSQGRPQHISSGNRQPWVFRFTKTSVEDVAKIATEIFGGTTYFCYYSVDEHDETSD